MHVYIYHWDPIVGFMNSRSNEQRFRVSFASPLHSREAHGLHIVATSAPVVLDDSRSGIRLVGDQSKLR